MMNELILATSNPGKIQELTELLKPIVCIPQNTVGISDVEEDGLTFIENALIKARHACLLSGKPALADDSGLVVPALKGKPGIYSARYAGNEANSQANMELLLRNMAHLESEYRDAYFYCAIAVVQHATDPTPLIATGMVHGSISLYTQGDGGFGYDPIFYLKEHQCTMAQLPSPIKNKISHRAQALNQLRRLILNTHE